jgi:hypothetical protein
LGKDFAIGPSFHLISPNIAKQFRARAQGSLPAGESEALPRPIN